MYAVQSRKLIAAAVVALPTLAAVHGAVLLWQGRVSSLELGLLLAMYVLTLLGVEGGFHRLASHRAFKTHPLVRNLFMVAGSMASQGPPIFWAATHRKHHTYTDAAGDPHSPAAQGKGLGPALKGFFHGHLGWLFADETADAGRYAPDLLRDRGLLRINQLYPAWVLLGLLLPAVLAGLATGTWAGAYGGLLWGGLVRIFLVHHAVWSVNSLCHLVGSRPNPQGGESRNNFVLALFTLGGAWHNNHHAFPGAASLSFRWWQLDITGLFIQSLAGLKLASELRGLPEQPAAAMKSPPGITKS